LSVATDALDIINALPSSPYVLCIQFNQDMSMLYVCFGRGGTSSVVSDWSLHRTSFSMKDMTLLKKISSRHQDWKRRVHTYVRTHANTILADDDIEENLNMSSDSNDHEGSADIERDFKVKSLYLHVIDSNNVTNE
jgi:hypothetical protein